MKYIIRVRLVAPNGDEGYTDIPTDKDTAERLMDAGCDRFFGYDEPRNQKTHTYIEAYNLSYVDTLARQRDEYRKAVVAAEQAKTILANKK